LINTEAMRASPAAFEKNAGVAAGYPGIRTRARSAEGRAQAFIEETAENLDWIYDQTPADVRDVSADWYVGANRVAGELAQKHGVDVEEAAGVIAALSPQKDWYQNVSLADRVLGIYAKGRSGEALPAEALTVARRIYGKPQYAEDLAALGGRSFDDLTTNQKSMYVRSYDEALSDRGYDIISPTGDRMRRATVKSGAPATAAWGSNREIGKAISVIEDPSIENISRQMGGQHKVRNFYNNIADPFHAESTPELGDYTSDTHNVAAALMQPLGGSATPVAHNFGGTGSASSALSGAQGTYGLYADAGRLAAANRGIIPRAMQSVTWESIRNLFPASFKTRGNVEDIENVWKLYTKGKISKDAARQLIVEKAGGMDSPDWAVGPRAGDDAGAVGALDEGRVRQAGASGSGGVDARAELDSLVPECLQPGWGLDY
jgi:hypothetical protein